MQEEESKITNNENNSYSLVDYLNIFFNNKKFIILNCLLIGIITAVMVFFIMDPIFYSSGTVKTIGKSSGLSSLISGGMPDIGDLGDLAGSSSTSKELALYENILLTRRCVEETIVKFNLMDEYKIQFMLDAVKHFKDNIMEIKKDKLAGTMEIGIFDKDPQKAKEMTDFLISQLNKINIELNVQDAKNNREFIQSRYDLTSIDLKNVEDSLRIFQDKNGIAPDLIVQAVSKIVIELEASIKAEEVKLDLLSKILSPEEAEVKSQREKIDVLKKQLSEINNSDDNTGNLGLKGSPGIIIDYFRLRRDVEIQNKILTTLIPLLEQAKIEENRNTPSVLIVDPPNVPDKKVKPKRLTSVAIFMILTFILSYLFLLFRSKWSYYKLKLNIKR